jgi:hypothetical protein
MSYFNVWQISSYNLDMMDSVGIYMKMASFSVASMYNALIQLDMPIDKINNASFGN